MIPLAEALNKFGRRGLIATFLAGSLLFGGTAYAKDVGLAAGRRIRISATEDALSKSAKLRNLVDTTVALTDKTKTNIKNVSDLLYRTGVHESGQLRYTSQKGGGPAKGYFQVEPATAADVVQRWAKTRPDVLNVLEKTSGVSRKNLLSMSQAGLGRVLERNPLFSTAVARYRYKMDPRAAPRGLKKQADYWQIAYQRGGKKVRQARVKSFLTSNREFSRKVSQVMLNQQKVSSKMGNATYKASKFIRKLIAR